MTTKDKSQLPSFTLNFKDSQKEYPRDKLFAYFPLVRNFADIFPNNTAMDIPEFISQIETDALIAQIDDAIKSEKIVPQTPTLGFFLCAFNDKEKLTFENIAKNDRSMLDYIIKEKLYDNTTDTCATLAKYGSLEQLQKVRENGCLWDELTCMNAAENGHLDVLQWARHASPPCPWDKYTCAFAAKNGHLDVLQWARHASPPCPWDELTCAYAAQNGHLDVMQWARENGCPCPPEYANM